jgi:hypothetical protein
MKSIVAYQKEVEIGWTPKVMSNIFPSYSEIHYYETLPWYGHEFHACYGYFIRTETFLLLLHDLSFLVLVKSVKVSCPTQITQYNSPHNRDIIFGSLGHAKSAKWTGIGLAFPTDYNTTLEAIH